MRRAFGIALFLSLVGLSGARAEAPVVDLQTWTQLQAGANLDALVPHGFVNLETTLRRGSPALIDDHTGTRTESPLTYVFVRPSIGYSALPWLSLALGYAWAPVYYDDAALRAEHEVHEQRVWEELGMSHSTGHVTLASRTRPEQRRRSHGPGAGETAHRIRERLRVAVTLVENSPWQLVASTELMFFTNHTHFESVPGFSENRAFAGIAYRFPGAQVEFGYLNQYVGGHAHVHRVNHVLSTSVSFRFDVAHTRGEGA